jgi:hypothetical protein
VTAARDYAVRVAARRAQLPHRARRRTARGELRRHAHGSAYARLPQQAVSGTRGDLSALAGSTASIEVTFDRDLETVSGALEAAPSPGCGRRAAGAG